MFRFTIRELVLLTLVVAMGVAWWLDHRVWVANYAATTHDSEIWQARAEAMQVRVELLAERLRTNPIPNPSAPAENLPSN
jgi:hypothetical protein